MINHRITLGLSETYSKKTTGNDAYTASNEGTLDYLVSTPAIMFMVIDASTNMLDKLLPPDYITVGKKIEIFHENASLVGDMLTLKLVVENVEGNSISLKFEVNDSVGVVCSGKYQRAIISKTRLLELAYKRSPGLV